MNLLVRLLFAHSGRVLLATLLGVIVIGSNMGLLGAASYLIAAASVTHLMALLIIPMYAVRILSAARGSARYGERLVSHRVTFDILARLRMQLFDGLCRLGPAGMTGAHSGDVLVRIMTDVETLQNGYLLFVAPVAVALLTVVLIGWLLAPFSSLLLWITLGYTVAGAVLLPTLAVALTRRPGNTLVSSRAALHEHFVETIQGSRDLLTNGASQRFLRRIVAETQTLAHAEKRLALVTAGREGAFELITRLAMLTALAMAIPLVTDRSLQDLYIAVPALLVLAAFEAFRPLGQAAESASTIQAAAARVLALDAKPAPIHDPASPVALQEPYSITFEGVTLTYPGAVRAAVEEITFHVPHGAHVAVVGPSGSGKTSLIRLLTRAWDPTAGRILIGAADIRHCSLHTLRATVGVVGQDAYIFNDTLRGNLLLTRPDASDTEMTAALHAVGLGELLQTMPSGLDTWVGEHGNRLSGGERQRLAAARIVLQDAPVVLLDEMTANLDPRTEIELLDTIHRLTVGRTVLMITHRLVGLERMDEIVVLNRGRIVERGTHQQLAARPGLYRRMLDVQDNMLTL